MALGAAEKAGADARMSSLLGVEMGSGGCSDSDRFAPLGSVGEMGAWTPEVSLCSTDRLMAFKPLAWEGGTRGRFPVVE